MSARKLMDTAVNDFSSRSATSLEHKAVPPRCVRVFRTQTDRAPDLCLAITKIRYMSPSRKVGHDQNTTGTGGPHTDSAFGPAGTFAMGVSRFTKSPSA
jgi:hypothetical protein